MYLPSSNMFLSFLLTQALVFANWVHARTYDTGSLVGRFDLDPASYQPSSPAITKLSVRSLYPRLPICPPATPVLCGYTEDGGKISI